MIFLDYSGEAGSMATESSDQSPSTEANDDTLRLFIAFPLPAQIKAQLADVQSRLKKGFEFAACWPAWVNPETIHVTLRFLGPTPRSKVPAIAEALSAVSILHSPPEIKVQGLDVFPNWREPRVLWAGMSDKAGRVGALQEAIERAMQGLGFEAEKKNFSPHLTLARFKSRRGVEAARKVVASHREFKTDRLALGEVVLYQSAPSAQGARHIPLQAFPLGEAAATAKEPETLQSLSKIQKDA